MSVVILSEPCSAFQFTQPWAPCLAGSGVGTMTWHSAREHGLCHTVRARSFFHASFMYCITEPMKQRLYLKNESKLMSRRTFICLFWILSIRKYIWKYFLFCVIFESFHEEKRNIQVTGCGL